MDWRDICQRSQSLGQLKKPLNIWGISEHQAFKAADHTGEKQLKLLVTWSKACWQPQMGFKTMTHHQHSNPPIRYMNGSRAKEVICESQWHSFKRRQAHSVSLFLWVCICSPPFFFHSWPFIHLKFVPLRCVGVLAVLCAVVNVKWWKGCSH